MAIGPWGQYSLPGVYGPGSVSWACGDGPVPNWAQDVIKDVCMANVGRMRSARIPGWMDRYFKRKSETARKKMRRENQEPIGDVYRHVKTEVSNERVTIRWDYVGVCTIIIPKEMLVPCTTTILAVHDC